MTDGDRIAKHFFRIKLNNNYFIHYKHHGSLNHDDFMKHSLDGISKVRCIFKYQYLLVFQSVVRTGVDILTREQLGDLTFWRFLFKTFSITSWSFANKKTWEVFQGCLGVISPLSGQGYYWHAAWVWVLAVTACKLLGDPAITWIHQNQRARVQNAFLLATASLQRGY